MLPVTYGYTRHLLSVCALGDCAEGLTAVLPCQWSYGELARPLTAHPPDDPIYADWIGMFGNDDYDGLVAQTTALLDRLVDPTDERRMAALSADLRAVDPVRSGVLGHGVRRTTRPPVPPTEEEPRCVRCGSTKTCRCVWTRSTT